MGCFGNSSPAPINYGATTASTLTAQTAEAPQLFAAESDPNFGQAAYSGLSLENLNTLLNGTPGGTSTVSYDKSIQSTGGWYDATGKFLTNQRSARPGGATWYKNGQIFQVPTTATLTRPAEQGWGETLRTLDPNTNALLGRINSQAMEGLDAGSSLTPEQQHMIDQQSLAEFARRGTSGSGASVVDSIMNRLNYGDRLWQQRAQFAQGAISANESAYLDPLINILGRASSTDPNLYNPQAGLPVSQANFNTAAQFAAARPTGASLIAQGVGAAAGVAGAVAAAA